MLSVPICTSTSPQARSFIYSTAPPLGIAAAALAAMNFLGSSERRAQTFALEKNQLDAGASPRDSGAGLTKNTRHASSAIFPWIVGDEQSVIDLASALQKEGFLVPAIRYPTVAKGSARLRMTVTAAHEEEQIRSLCQAIKRLSG